MNNPKSEIIVADFINILNKSNQYHLLPEISEMLQKEVLKNQEITVISAVEIEEKEKKDIEQLLFNKWSEHKINWLIDPMLLSGLIVKFQNQIIDASGKNQLASLKNALK